VTFPLAPEKNQPLGSLKTTLIEAFGAMDSDIRAKLLRAICACVLLGMLVAGVWPFHAPRNAVSWLGTGSGLVFGKHGSIVSASPFNARAALERQFLQSPDMVRAEPDRLRGWRHDSRVLFAGE